MQTRDVRKPAASPSAAAWWLSYSVWKAQCRLNRALPGLESEAVRRANEDVFETADVRAEAGVELCIFITTYRRPEACRELLVDLHRELPATLATRTRVFILEDASSADYTPARKLAHERFGTRARWLRASRWLGKAGYYVAYRAAFDIAGVLTPRRALFLQDDLSLAPGFFERAFAHWDSIRDPRKAVLSLISMDEDEPNGRWIQFAREPLAGEQLRRTQWFDLPAYLVDGRFFETLDYRVFAPDPLRFRRQGDRSSSVGEQLTRRLWRRANVYQVVETLAYHGAHASVMNADARVARPLDNRPAARRGERQTGTLVTARAGA